MRAGDRKTGGPGASKEGGSAGAFVERLRCEVNLARADESSPHRNSQKGKNEFGFLYNRGGVHVCAINTGLVSRCLCELAVEGKKPVTLCFRDPGVRNIRKENQVRTDVSTAWRRVKKSGGDFAKQRAVGKSFAKCYRAREMHS